MKQEEARLKEKGYNPKDMQIVNEESTGSKDYLKLLNMTYQQVVDYLLKLHGPAQYDYFTNESCVTKNTKVVRSKEGLYCHHIDEDKTINLSTQYYAQQNPFEYQKANRLVYCDILEHLILHIKIAEEAEKITAKGEQLGLGGIFNFMCPQINDAIEGRAFRYEYQIKTQFIVQSHFNEYIQILKYLIKLLKQKWPESADGYIGFLYINSDGKKVKSVFDELY